MTLLRNAVRTATASTSRLSATATPFVASSTRPTVVAQASRIAAAQPVQNRLYHEKVIDHVSCGRFK